MTPASFSEVLRDQLKMNPQLSAISLIPKNKRSMYQQVIERFEETGIHYSQTGMTANVIALWLKSQGRYFVLSWHQEGGVGTWIIRARRRVKR